MEQNNNLPSETTRRKPLFKVLVSVLIAALAAFVMIPITSTLTNAQQQGSANDTVTVTGDSTGVAPVIEVTKTLDEEKPGEKQFRFGLYDGDDMIADATSDSDGVAKFVLKKTKKAGTKTYTVKEIDAAGNDLSGKTVDGVVYDKAKTVTVNVTREEPGDASQMENPFEEKKTALGQNKIVFAAPVIADENGAVTGA